MNFDLSRNIYFRNDKVVLVGRLNTKEKDKTFPELVFGNTLDMLQQNKKDDAPLPVDRQV